jgi:hypothetical protein
MPAETWFHRTDERKKREERTMKEEKQGEENRAMRKKADEGHTPSY